ncbi:hypothetical protein EDD22DRAFT_1005719 [Suillus occidentalis]|nr:hypothetical protein EDD22DRAFT_1005719 [Suillus occidentalis]
MLTPSTELDITKFQGGIHPKKSILVQVPYHLTNSTSSLSRSFTLHCLIIPSTFCTNPLEEPSLRSFRSSWLEALGDLARYRMAAAAMVTNNQLKGPALTTDAVSRAVADMEPEKHLGKSSPWYSFIAQLPNISLPLPPP